MKLMYSGEVAFNINGMAIHLGLVILLEKKNQWTKSIKWWKNDNLIKNYDQLHLLVVDEISLVGNIMLSSIDYRLWIIKQVHNQFMGGLDVIIISDFYQTP